MKRFFLSILALVALSLAAVSAQEAQTLPNDPAVKTGKLDNGLTYYIRHNEQPEGRAEFYLATNVGAIQETPDQDGLAHFLEHMCFNGTKNFPDKAILNYLQSIGASFGGNVNAQTGVENTVYMLTNIPILRESVVDSCILIMHDYAHYVTCDPVEIDKERGVIIEERRARRNAAWRMYEKSLPYYYGDSKYATCTLIGSQENLETFKPESLTNFYHTWYRPDLQAFIVVGDVDVDRTEQKIKDIFGEIPAAENPKPKDIITIPDNDKPLVGILTDPEATSSTIEILWKSEPMPKEYNNTLQGYLVNLIKTIAGQVMNERLGDIAARPDAPFLGAAFAIANLCDPCEVVEAQTSFSEGGAVTAFKAVYQEVLKMARFGFTEDEIGRAKDEILAEYESAANKASTRKNNELVQELIDNFFDNYPYMEPAKELQLMQQMLPMLSADMINGAIKDAVPENNLVVLYNAPEKEGLSHPTEEDFLSAIDEVNNTEIQANESEEVAKELLDPSALKGSKVTKEYAGLYGSTVLELANGAKVILYPTDIEKDKIILNMVKRGGMTRIETGDLDSFDDNVFGLFLQNSGLSSFSATTLSKMLAGKKVSVAPYINAFRHGVQASSSVKDFETALQGAYLYFADPRFDPDEFSLGIKTISSVLPNLVKQPNYALQKEVNKTLYGDNPRMRLIDEKTLENASLATIEKNWRAMFNDAAGLTVIIGGDFSVAEVKPLVCKYIGSIQKGKKDIGVIGRDRNFVTGEVSRDFSEDMQTPMTTVINFYHCDTPFSFLKEAALSAASYILDMRYVTSLREDEGGTYGAGTSAGMSMEPKQMSTLQISYNSKPSSADRLRELAMKDLKALGEEGPTAEEFDMAKKNLEKNIPESRLNVSHWTGALLSHELYGYDKDKDYETAVNALSAEDVRNAVKELLDSGNSVEVVMRPGSGTVEAE